MIFLSRLSFSEGLHSLSMGMPFIAQVMEGLGVPLALQVSTPFSPGARTRFLGAPLIQYGAAENRLEQAGELLTEHTALLASVHESIMRWRERENEQTKRERGRPSHHMVKGLMGHCWSHHTHTFDRDTNVLVNWAKLVPGSAAVFSCIRFRHVYYAQGLLVVQEGCARGWQVTTQFCPGDVRGGPGFRRRRRESQTLRVMKALEQVGTWWMAFRTEEVAGLFTHSPSATHSISSTCPLNTILELEGPDGMRKVGFLSSTGSSVVTHMHDNSSYYSSSASAHRRRRSRPAPGTSHSLTSLCCNL